jgi:hypothetical protein
MRLNPYVWGADTVSGVARNIRRHVSEDPADHEAAERETREADRRWNQPKKSKR